MWQKVEALAPLTGKNPVPEIKANLFRFEADKFAAAQLTRLASDLVKPMRALECPVQLEARVARLHRMGGERLKQLGGGTIAEIEVIRVHDSSELLLGENYIDPAKGHP
jgi:flavin reductase (DIM6/NTAB) family NADH-FMN oxidoreductase RutF